MRLLQAFALIGSFGSMAWTRAVAADPPFVARYEKLDPPAVVADPIRKLLAPDALVVGKDKDHVVMRVWFRAEIPAKATEEQVKNEVILKAQPTHEFVKAEEIGALSLYLASDEARQVTGTHVSIDGGWTAA